ncbi:MAG: copper amine oxidase N-terminal domain-containing protein [Oscillospiraceae bacterium]|jgi:hypothetical protein|nr:copper amine oxidase N-terminal domain-containing protein [Oscillospiraceae bacterium]
MRILRKVFMAALVIALSVGLYTIAAADEGEVSIQLNGKLIDFPSGVVPYYSSEFWRVFVPANDVFTQMGAQVGYDADTRTITLERGDVKVTFPQDGTTAEITVGGGDTKFLESDVKPVTINNRVLVPLRFVANALGCKVGWDQEAFTAIIIDPVSYLAGNTETFDTLTALADTQAEAEATGNQAIAAEIAGKVAAQGLNVDIALEFDATASQSAMDGALSGKLSIPPEAAEALMPGLSLSEIPLDAEVIFNIETGLLAVRYETANMLTGHGADTWIAFDGSLGAYGGAGDIAAQVNGGSADVGEAVKQVLTAQILAMPEPASVSDFGAVELQVGILYGLLSDGALVQTDDGYKSEFSYELAGVVTETALAVTTDADGKAAGITMTVVVKAGGETVSDAKLAFSDDAITMEIHAAAEGVTVDITVKMTVSPTDGEPRAQLPEGAETVSFSELGLTGLF